MQDEHCRRIFIRSDNDPLCATIIQETVGMDGIPGQLAETTVPDPLDEVNVSYNEAINSMMGDIKESMEDSLIFYLSEITHQSKLLLCGGMQCIRVTLERIPALDNGNDKATANSSLQHEQRRYEFDATVVLDPETTERMLREEKQRLHEAKMKFLASMGKKRKCKNCSSTSK